jgi:hypothetical protein
MNMKLQKTVDILVIIDSHSVPTQFYILLQQFLFIILQKQQGKKHLTAETTITLIF